MYDVWDYCTVTIEARSWSRTAKTQCIFWEGRNLNWLPRYCGQDAKMERAV